MNIQTQTNPDNSENVRKSFDSVKQEIINLRQTIQQIQKSLEQQISKSMNLYMNIIQEKISKQEQSTTTTSSSNFTNISILFIVFSIIASRDSSNMRRHYIMQ